MTASSEVFVVRATTLCAERELWSLCDAVLVGEGDGGRRQVASIVWSPGLQLGNRFEDRCHRCHEMIRSIRRHLSRMCQERSGIVESAGHHANATEHHWMRRLSRRHRIDPLSVDDCQTRCDVAFGQMDHRRQRQDESGVDTVDVEATGNLQ